MPIRLNLLAEAQAAEVLRRRDPVKRAGWLAGLLIAAMLLWSGWVQVRVLWATRELTLIDRQISTRTNEFALVQDSQTRQAEIQRKLAALRQLATQRFLNGNMLNALQHTTMDDVQLTRLTVKQDYLYNEEVKPKTNSSGRVLLGKPATVTEKILLTLEARDYGPNAGDQVVKFKERMGQNDYFQTALGKTNELRLADPTPPQTGPDGRTYVAFKLECRYPEKTR